MNSESTNESKLRNRLIQRIISIIKSVKNQISRDGELSKVNNY